jgi:hypothetical protein
MPISALYLILSSLTLQLLLFHLFLQKLRRASVLQRVAVQLKSGNNARKKKFIGFFHPFW